MTVQTNNTSLTALFALFFKKFLPWIPIIIGLIQQIRINFLGAEGTYVVLNPPEYIYPYVTLEIGWWLSLTILTGTLLFLTARNLIRPHRLVTPFYIYLVFLLLLVKPI